MLTCLPCRLSALVKFQECAGGQIQTFSHFAKRDRHFPIIIEHSNMKPAAKTAAKTAGPKRIHAGKIGTPRYNKDRLVLLCAATQVLMLPTGPEDDLEEHAEKINRMCEYIETCYRRILHGPNITMRYAKKADEIAGRVFEGGKDPKDLEDLDFCVNLLHDIRARGEKLAERITRVFTEVRKKMQAVDVLAKVIGTMEAHDKVARIRDRFNKAREETVHAEEIDKKIAEKVDFVSDAVEQKVKPFLTGNKTA